MRTNYHTHSRYCDGKGELREYVEYAIAHGFSALGFSGHAPVPFPNNFSIRQEQCLDYCNEVRALKAEYAGRIDIRHATLYNNKQKAIFLKYLEGQLAKIDIPGKDDDFLMERMLTMYAYPARNYHEAQ